MVNRAPPPDDKIVFSRRAFILGAAQAGLLSMVAGRLIYLGGIRSSHYQTLANDNRVKLQVILPDRGRLLDRYGVVLATNQWIHRLLLQPEGRSLLKNIFPTLQSLVDLSHTTLKDLEDLRENTPRHMPLIVKESLSWEEVCRCEMHLAQYPFLSVERGQRRFYPIKDGASHVVGYVQIPNDKDKIAPSFMGISDFRLGRTGLEKALDEQLRGTAGFKEIEVDAKRRIVRTLSVTTGKAGHDLTTTLDFDMQKKAYELLEPHLSGAIIALDVHTGAVRICASYPSFDNNLFTEGISHNAWNALNTNPYTPLHDKAIKGQYAPGSLFKMVIALAGLKHGKITPQTDFFCPGYIEVNNHRFHCHARHGHGQVTLERALRESCDVYFFESSRHIGIDRIEEMAKLFRFGQKTGILLPGEKEGLLPNRDWMREKNQRAWTLADTILTSIGQGPLLATPLQLAAYTAALANGGYSVKPLLLDRDSPEKSFLDIDPKHLSLIVKSMHQVVNHPQGTARNSRLISPHGEMAGKTGTSQVRRISKRERESGVLRNEDVQWRQRDHALFAGFAPFNNPRFSCVALIEHGGGGSRVAAPIVRDILKDLLDKEYNDQQT